jgi:hypothetical protein
VWRAARTKVSILKTGAEGGASSINFVLVTNNQSDLDGATQLEAVLEVHRQNRPDGVELAFKLVEIMKCINLQAVAHAFNTPGEAIACSVCKSAARLV